MTLRVRKTSSDPDYLDYEGNGISIGEAKPRDMTNAEKAEIKRREARRVPFGFQVPAKPQRRR